MMLYRAVPAVCFAFLVACGDNSMTTPDAAPPIDAPDTDADPCATDSPPAVTSSTADIGFPVGATSAAYMVTFDEPVTIADGGITVNNGASVSVTPALPATAAQFMIDIDGLVDGTNYALAIAATSVIDACGQHPASDTTVQLVSGCVDNVPPTFTSFAEPRRFANGSFTYTFRFDKPVTIAAGGIAIDNGATLAIVPALPATASSFEVTVSDLVDGTSYALTAQAAAITDVCGANPVAAQTVELTTCGDDTAAPVLTSDDVVLTCGPGAYEYRLAFDELVHVPADGVSLTGAATLGAITPSLPVVASELEVSLADVTGPNTLTIAAGITDDCGNATSDPITIDFDVGATTGSQTHDFTGSIIEVTIPDCPNLTIEAAGAEGGNHKTSKAPAGKGALMIGDFDDLSTRQFRVLVGQQPSVASGNGGGGGTFVVTRTNAPVIIAGGGGGSGEAAAPWADGTTTTTGQSCVAAGGGEGGTDGSGGFAGTGEFQSGAGGGLLTDGANGWTGNTGGRSFLSGGAGGTANGGARGGFGGGGSGSSYVVGGSGGGYSGGGSCSDEIGGGQSGAGGGSYNAGTNQLNTAGASAGHGQVVFTWN